MYVVYVVYVVYVGTRIQRSVTQCELYKLSVQFSNTGTLSFRRSSEVLLSLAAIMLKKHLYNVGKSEEKVARQWSYRFL